MIPIWKNKVNGLNWNKNQNDYNNLNFLEELLNKSHKRSSFILSLS